MPDLGPAEGHPRRLEILRALTGEFGSAIDERTVAQVVTDSFDRLAARAYEGPRLVEAVERLARQRLEARVRMDSHPADRVPLVLFMCVHNAGRSQMALGWFNHLADGRAVAWSGGSEPGSEVNPAAVAAMAEVGVDIAREFPKPWTDETVRAADVVVTMGCGDACPLFPGVRYEDWPLADPHGQGVDAVRPIRDEIEARVRSLLAELGVTVVA